MLELDCGPRDGVSSRPSHRVRVELEHFSAGRAMWRARCACRWSSAVATLDVVAAAQHAADHLGPWYYGAGLDPEGDTQ